MTWHLIEDTDDITDMVVSIIGGEPSSNTRITTESSDEAEQWVRDNLVGFRMLYRAPGVAMCGLKAGGVWALINPDLIETRDLEKMAKSSPSIAVLLLGAAYMLPEPS